MTSFEVLKVLLRQEGKILLCHVADKSTSAPGTQWIQETEYKAGFPSGGIVLLKLDHVHLEKRKCLMKT